MVICKCHPKTIEMIETGSLNSYVSIFKRNIKPTSDPTIDECDEILSDERKVFGSLETTDGIAIFDSTNQEIAITHLFYMRFLSDYEITSENWLVYLGNRYRIIKVENLQHEQKFLKLYLVQLGTQQYRVTLA